MTPINILTIDDDVKILDVYEFIFASKKNNEIEDALSELDKLFGGNESVNTETQNGLEFAVMRADNGLAGVDIFKACFAEEQEIPVCIIDMRMPNGIDGLETASRIKAIDSHVNIVISTAYSDKSLQEITEQIQNNIYYIRKPFNTEEIYQLVYSLSQSYRAIKAQHKLNMELENRVKLEVEKSRQKDAIMLHQAKLASHGETISNIAHQWRQPLSSMAVTLNKMGLRLSGDSTENKEFYLEGIGSALKSIEYMSQTISDFRSQTEPGKEKVEFSLGDVIKKSIALVEKNYVAANIQIVFSPERDMLTAGYPEDLKQVLLVLMNNAKDAILGKEGTDGVINIVLSENNTGASISVCDNGGGISDENFDHIFEPYFTTKHKSQGTGLGLYMANRIIQERFNGSIQAHNYGNGACFCLELKK